MFWSGLGRRIAHCAWAATASIPFLASSFMLSVSWRLSSIAQGLCHMHAADLLRLRQIGNRARHSQYAGITTRREAHPLCGLCQNLEARPVRAPPFFPPTAAALCLAPPPIPLHAP